MLSEVLAVFLRALFALERRRARRLGILRGQTGAVSHLQRFGSALQLTPHFHSLVPDGIFVARESGTAFEELPPPTQAEVERLLEGVHRRVLRLLERRGALPGAGPEDALEGYQAASLQQRFRWQELDLRPPPLRRSREMTRVCSREMDHLRAERRAARAAVGAGRSAPQGDWGL